MRSGGISILILVTALVFSIMLGGIVVFGATQYTGIVRGASYKKALMIAEAGVHYYRWHLTHDPDDYQDGTGTTGPYEHTYTDPQGGTVGTYTLEIVPPSAGSSVVEIISTGEEASSGIRRTVKALFGRPSLAQYAFLHNSNTWFGSGMTISGKVMSNGGIRQDGYNLSTVQSAKESYTCGTETGCIPSESKPAIWGIGGPDSLWEYPVAQVDFDGVIADFDAMKTAATANSTYFGPSGSQGYYFDFIDDGSVDVYRVNNTNWRQGYSEEGDCVRLYERMGQKSLVGNYILSGEDIFFAEDNIWVDGVVEGRATLAAARLPLNSNQTNIWITDNLAYKEKDGSDVLGLVAANNIYFGLDVPTIFEIDAAMLAQDGRILRHHYSKNGCSNNGGSVRDELIVYGSIISNLQATWNWGNGPDSGFTQRTITYDNNLFLAPPPYFPTADELTYLSFEEIDNP